MIEEKYNYFTFGIWEHSFPYFKHEHYHGFVYRITNKLDDSFYIGKKEFSGNWKTYTSSSKPMNEMIKEYGFDNFTFEMICLCKNEKEMVLEERSRINKEKVLNEHLLINLN